MKREVYHNGKTYSYEVSFEKSGRNGLMQTIYVVGVGSLKDPVIYGGEYGHPRISMESTARVIAGEIVRKNVINED